MHAVTIISAGDNPGKNPVSSPRSSSPVTPERKPNPFQGAGAAYIMVAAALMGPGIGYLIDQARGTSPFWTITCFAIFLVAGGYHMIKEGTR